MVPVTERGIVEINMSVSSQSQATAHATADAVRTALKTVAVVAIISVTTVLLSACQSSPAGTTADDGTDATAESGLEAKQGTTTLEGTVSGSAGAYVLENPTAPPTPIESYDVDLSTHVGDRVTVSGQYSGNTLFVTEVE